MRGIEGRERLYVKVASVTEPDGAVTPVSVEWPDGRVFAIDRVYDVRRARSLKAGGTGLRYTVGVLGSKTYLWLEGPRWFVEAKVYLQDQ